MKECSGCGRNLMEDELICPTCGFRFKENGIKPGKKPFFAAILLLISGLAALLLGAMLYMGDTSSMLEAAGTIIDIEIAEGIFELIITICAITIIFIGILQFLGAYLSFKRRNRFAVIIIAFLGIFSIGMMFASSILSLIALVLVFISEDDFL